MTIYDEIPYVLSIVISLMLLVALWHLFHHWRPLTWFAFLLGDVIHLALYLYWDDMTAAVFMYSLGVSAGALVQFAGEGRTSRARSKSYASGFDDDSDAVLDAIFGGA